MKKTINVKMAVRRLKAQDILTASFVPGAEGGFQLGELPSDSRLGL